MTFLWTTIQVADLDRSLAFYHDLLGLPLQERFQGTGREIAMLGTAEGTKLELICGGNPPPVPPAPGLSLGLGPENMAQQLERLRQAGYSIPVPVSPNPSLRFYFIPDPDGYTVQLVEQLG